jgi:sugar fermentation stimulation protein A
MKYNNVLVGKFIERPNRFIAFVDINGERKVCHVKNTGRCKELLVHGATVFLDKSEKLNRKTEFDLIAVEKNGAIINIDSQAPNIVANEFLSSFFGNDAKIYREKTFKKSRFDFYIESGERKIFLEVKGVTLEENGIVRFPDAPTERGIKHINELVESMSYGYEAYILFVIQMKGVNFFEPNDNTHKLFGDALRSANSKGVKILAYDCIVTSDSIKIDSKVKVNL